MNCKKEDQKYYVGLDIGTNSVGWAVTDKYYDIPRFHGEPAWGVTLFDEAETCATRRAFRTARRRLDRRKQRVVLIQELFAKEIGKSDPSFFHRLQASRLFRDDAGSPYTLFNDPNYTDKDYHKEYPTIHHLIVDLMQSSKPHDSRLVYLAIAWLVAHRGHFLNNIAQENVAGIKDFTGVYQDFISFFEKNGFCTPWKTLGDPSHMGDILKKKSGVLSKNKQLIELLYAGEKPSKEGSEDFPFNRVAIIKLLAGGTCKLADLFNDPAYDELGSFTLGADEEKFTEIAGNLGEDFELISSLRALYDWSVLVEALGEYKMISEAKVAVYQQHQKDLRTLKCLIRKYCPEKYNEVFRVIGKDKDNYPAYVFHTDEADCSDLKKKDIEAFSKYLKGILGSVNPEPKDQEAYNEIMARIDLKSFMPKQKTTDNRVIPQQLLRDELDRILDHAEQYLPFLKDSEDGLTVSDKIRSVFSFKIPYYVGPLNKGSKYSWIERKAGKIYPWNFNQMVDLDASEQRFIQRMTNYCTYLPGEPVLPKDSLAYHKFMVLNEINNIRINGERISVELKQKLYNECFMVHRKVTRKMIVDFFRVEISDETLRRRMDDLVSGIDTQINSNLAPQIAFKRILEKGILTEKEVEDIIERASFAEDKSRLSNWLSRKYTHLSEEDRRYICSIRIKDFGRLSQRFLCEMFGVDPETGEMVSVLNALWNSQYNLMELLGDSNPYEFAQVLKAIRDEYYSENKKSLQDRMQEMYLSGSVKRSVFRTMAVMKDIEKAFGRPKRIFIEVARGSDEEQKGKRTKTRKQQILEFYENCKNEEVKVLKEQLEAMGEYADSRLQGDKLFLYYMQLGKCMYSGEPIVLEKLGSKEYDIDHIYPQSYVKDDSILNNRVLVLSKLNGKKGDQYPIAENIRTGMAEFWRTLKEHGLITEEKYKRLIRSILILRNTIVSRNLII